MGEIGSDTGIPDGFGGGVWPVVLGHATIYAKVGLAAEFAIGSWSDAVGSLSTGIVRGGFSRSGALDPLLLKSGRGALRSGKGKRRLGA